MAPPPFRLCIAISFLFMVFSLSLASMSIIDYDLPADPLQSTERTEAHMMKMYEHWLVKHGKNYNAIGEKERRFEIFKDNLRFVDEQNSVPGRTYKLGLTKFADLTNEEYRAMYLGAKMEKKEKLRTERSQRYLHKAGNDDDLPSHVDWREKGAVTEVKDHLRMT